MFDCRSKGWNKILLDIFKVILYLVITTLQVAYMLAAKFSFFHYLFFIIYVGAILVLISYLFFSRLKTVFNWKFYTYLFVILNLLLLQVKKDSFSSELQKIIYLRKELACLVFFCLYIILILHCILFLDFFRFSSLRTLF